MKKIIVTGAAGYIGYHLTKALSDQGYCVYAVVRPGSINNIRIQGLPGVILIEADIKTLKVEDLPADIKCNIECIYHLAWMEANRYDYREQMEGAFISIRILELAPKLGCKRFVGIGSQAEYGLTMEIMNEDETKPNPFCGYGASKVAACYLTRRMASELGIEWVWGRIFSVYGQYEPVTRLIPSLIRSYRLEEEIRLSSCRQCWDFLYSEDAARAIIAIGERGINGNIYNIANGEYKPLKEFVICLKKLLGSKSSIFFGDDPNPFVSLQPSVTKITRDTGWLPLISFEEGIRKMMIGISDEKGIS